MYHDRLLEFCFQPNLQTVHSSRSDHPFIRRVLDGVRSSRTNHSWFQSKSFHTRLRKDKVQGFWRDGGGPREWTTWVYEWFRADHQDQDAARIHNTERRWSRRMSQRYIKEVWSAARVLSTASYCSRVRRARSRWYIWWQCQWPFHGPWYRPAEGITE